MKSFVIRLLCLICIVLDCCGAFAQASSPEQRTREYFLALKNDGLVSTVKFFHPADLARFRDMLIPIFEAEAEEGGSELRSSLFGAGTTIQQVQEASPALVMTKFFGVISGPVGSSLTFDTMDVLGTVPEGELMHVVTRFKFGVETIGASKLELVSLSKYQGEWMVVLNGQYDGIAKALAARRKSKR